MNAWHVSDMRATTENLGGRVFAAEKSGFVIKYVREGAPHWREHRALVALEGKGVTPEYRGWFSAPNLPTGEPGPWRGLVIERYPWTLNDVPKLNYEETMRFVKTIEIMHDHLVWHGDLSSRNTVLRVACDDDGKNTHYEARIIDFGKSVSFPADIRPYYEATDLAAFDYRAFRAKFTFRMPPPSSVLAEIIDEEMHEAEDEGEEEELGPTWTMDGGVVVID